MASMFAWMRPNDLVWNYWVNNYLLGNDPPAFDILYWNNDTTRLPAQLHADLLDLIDSNPFVHPRRLKARGTPIDMKKVDVEAYVIAGSTDHITPWTGCYRTARLYGPRGTFVVSNSGHIQSLLNPPGNPKAFFVAGPPHAKSAEAWLPTGTRHEGSWWPHWRAWIKPRSAPLRKSPRALGSRKHPPLCDTPGEYVRET
jgi:polyhydroxyalkanoate synthase